MTIPPIDPNAGDRFQVWLYSQRYSGVIGSYASPLTDCICRFGFAQPTLDFSPDGQYLVAGWPIGKGAEPLVVYRVSDRARVASFDTRVQSAIWDRAGIRLFASGSQLTETWTPGGGVSILAAATPWPFLAGISPDGTQVAYTAYANAAQFTDLRVYAYDVKTGMTRLLTDQQRSQVLFVKDGWVWYLEEAPCATSGPGCGP